MTTASTTSFSDQWPPPGLKDLVGRIPPRPVFLIGKELIPTYVAAAGEPRQLWEIPEASHTGGIEARPDEYE